MAPQRPHHQLIWEILSHFNNPYLNQHQILFGGGTRIALELSEYRESVDIDFLCATPKSYKAVRSQVTTDSLGELLTHNTLFTFPRGIRADRDAVRTFIQFQNVSIKLEFVHFDYYDLQSDKRIDLFPVPFIDQSSCFLTKLLANADRYSEPSQKDICDLCIMYLEWGEISESIWKKADEKYGLKSVFFGLDQALNKIVSRPDDFQQNAVNRLLISPEISKAIATQYAPALMKYINAQKNRGI